MNAKMYEIGEKYGVKGLKGLAQRKFDIACELYWDDEVFPHAVRYVFESTVDEDEGLRSIVYKTIRENLELVKKKEVAAVMNEFNLAMAILVDMSNDSD